MKKDKKKKDVKDKKKSNSEEKIGLKLNPRQELFCRLYTQNTELFSNATLCYAQAYGFKLDTLSTEPEYEEIEDEEGMFHSKKVKESPYTLAYNSCSVMGNALLRNIKINTRMSVLLNELMTTANADAELAYLIQQRKDPGVKLGALREFNKLKGRIKNIVEIVDTPIDEKLKTKANNILANYIDGLTKDTQK